MSLDWSGLRRPFPPEQVGKLPRTAKRPELDYVGHAAVTDRLNTAAPDWSYHIEPVVVLGRIVVEKDGTKEKRRFEPDPEGLPHVVAVFGSMTVQGVTREEVGEVDAFTTYGDELKKAISDFIRRGAMRFGVAIDLWSKEDLDGAGVQGRERETTSLGQDESPVQAPATDVPAEPQGAGEGPSAASDGEDRGAGEPPAGGSPILADRHRWMDRFLPGSGGPAASAHSPATPAQQRMMRALAKGFEWDDAELHRQAQVASLNDLTRGEASYLIDHWKKAK